MVDFHSHILPNMDDGSRSTEESVQLLELLCAQGVDTVAATPHFYAQENPPEAFLSRRAEAWERLRPRLTERCPRVLLGAEVHYFRGISRARQLRMLCLEDTPVLLLEMPFSAWPAGVVEELDELLAREDVRVVLAHVERYLPQQPRALWERLRRQGALFQCNASFFLDWRTRRRAMKMLRGGEVSLLGSDCHGVSYRPPHMDTAAERIRRHAGDAAWQRLEENARQLIAAGSCSSNHQ